METEPLIPLPDPVHYMQLKTMSEALKQAQTLSGLDDKELCGKGDDCIVTDPSTWSKIKRGIGYFPHDKYVEFNKRVENLITLAWLADQHGYMLRPKETELRKMLRLKDELIRDRDLEIQVLRKLLKETT